MAEESVRVITVISSAESLVSGNIYRFKLITVSIIPNLHLPFNQHAVTELCCRGVVFHTFLSMENTMVACIDNPRYGVRLFDNRCLELEPTALESAPTRDVSRDY